MRKGILRSALLGAAALGAISIAGAGVAQAGTVTLAYSTDGGSTIHTIATGPSPQLINNPVTAGNFTIDGLSAFGTPPLPSPTLDSNSLDVASTGTGNLTIYVVENGINNPLGNYNLKLGFTTNLYQPSAGYGSVTESAYADTTDTSPVPNNWSTAMANWTLLGSQTLASNQAVNPVVTTPDFTGSYAYISVFNITATKAGFTSNNTIDLQDVPEPGSLALLGTGLLGLGLIVRRRRRKA